MANWHVVLAYDERVIEWLSEMGYRHPPVRAGNRLPTWVEIEDAVSALGLGRDSSLAVEDPGTGESLSMRGDLVLELRLLRHLAMKSGQLWVYPDCGSPAIVVDSTTDPEAVAEAWLRSLVADDPWLEFLGRADDVGPTSGR